MRRNLTTALQPEMTPIIIQTVQDYGKNLFRYIRKRVLNDADAEDVLQDVWMKFSHAMDAEPIEQVSSWLYAVARNRISDKQRKQSPAYLEDFSYESEDGTIDFRDILFSDDHTPETAYLKKVFWDALFSALAELPESQRTVFIKNELEDKSLQQIADESGQNIKTIISRKRYAVLHLRERLADLYRDLINY
jgi:RNA polymerase sigma factor (sigma-70 family)